MTWSIFWVAVFQFQVVQVRVSLLWGSLTAFFNPKSVSCYSSVFQILHNISRQTLNFFQRFCCTKQNNSKNLRTSFLCPELPKSSGLEIFPMFLEDPGLPAMDLSPTSEPAVVSTVEADTSMAPTPASMTIHVIGEDEEPQEMLKAFPAEPSRFWDGFMGWMKILEIWEMKLF